jgi:tetratricopeptide (TPR) repeat protein
MCKKRLLIKLVMLLSVANSCSNNKNTSSIPQECINLNDSAINLVYKSSNFTMNQRLTDAIALLDKATKIDSADYVAYYNKRTYQLKLKQYNDALLTSKQMIKLSPNNGDNYFYVGVLCIKAGDTASSMPYFKRALSLYNNVLDTMNIKNVRYKSLKMAKATDLIVLGQKQKGNEILKDLYNKETDTLAKQEYLNILKTLNNHNIVDSIK